MGQSGAFAGRMIGRLEPWMGRESGIVLTTSTEQPTGPLLETTGSLPITDYERFVRSLAFMFEEITVLAEGEDGAAGYVPAWGTLLNVNTCPGKDLSYLGQFVGVEVPRGASEAQARSEVRRHAGEARGTLLSIEEVIRATLPPGTVFVLQERTAANGSEAAYHFNILVPVGKSTVVLREAVEAITPGGLFFSVIEIHNSWIQGTKKWNEVAAGKTWAAIVEGEY